MLSNSIDSLTPSFPEQETQEPRSYSAALEALEDSHSYFFAYCQKKERIILNPLVDLLRCFRRFVQEADRAQAKHGLLNKNYRTLIHPLTQDIAWSICDWKEGVKQEMQRAALLLQQYEKGGREETLKRQLLAFVHYLPKLGKALHAQITSLEDLVHKRKIKSNVLLRELQARLEDLLCSLKEAHTAILIQKKRLHKLKPMLERTDGPRLFYGGREWCALAKSRKVPARSLPGRLIEWVTHPEKWSQKTKNVVYGVLIGMRLTVRVEKECRVFFKEPVKPCATPSPLKRDSLEEGFFSSLFAPTIQGVFDSVKNFLTNPEFEEGEGQKDFESAVQGGELEKIAALLEKGASPIYRNTQGQTALHFAIENRDLAALKLIGAKFSKAHLNAKDGQGNT